MDLTNRFIDTVENTNWFNIEKKYYYQATKKSGQEYITGPLVLGTTINLNDYSYGNVMGYNLITEIIYDNILNKNLPDETSSIYLLLASPDIQDESKDRGFCSWFCGYHSYFTKDSNNYVFSYMVNHQNCTGCLVNKNSSPNNDVGIDGMIDTLAHEIVEAISDPLLNAWYDSAGWENADKW